MHALSKDKKDIFLVVICVALWKLLSLEASQIETHFELAAVSVSKMCNYA